MSTRCQLRFTDSESNRVAQVYRHSDGYPEGVLPVLKHLRRLVQITGTQRDPTYAAAQFLFVDKLWSLKRTFRGEGLYEDYPASVEEALDVEAWEECSKTPSYLLGHGVENPSDGIHGDEEYLFRIELPMRSPLDASTEWRVSISEHCGFPRWDGPTEEAFEVATWQFEGPLEAAVAELGRDS